MTTSSGSRRVSGRVAGKGVEWVECEERGGVVETSEGGAVALDSKTSRPLSF